MSRYLHLSPFSQHFKIRPLGTDELTALINWYLLFLPHRLFRGVSYFALIFLAAGPLLKENLLLFSLRGRRTFLVLLALLPLMALYTWWYSFYNHFGVTALGENFAGNSITAEALFYGASLSLRAGAVALFISCLLAVFTADKVVYLFGRLSPKLSLFIAILLRSAPRTLAYARRISISQQGLGRGPGPFERLEDRVRERSEITWLAAPTAWQDGQASKIRERTPELWARLVQRFPEIASYG